MGTDLDNDKNLLMITDPIMHVQAWLDEAVETEVNDANAMSLTTVDEDDMPNVRIVLLKEIAPEGFYFYTNRNSAKGQELHAHAKAAICLHWKSLRRQIRVRGLISLAPEEKSDNYFASRHPTSQLGSYTSKQSAPLGSYEQFEQECAETKARLGDPQQYPRPKHWGGYILSPLSIEFWEEKQFRLHTRRVFTRTNLDSTWESTLLYP